MGPIALFSLALLILEHSGFLREQTVLIRKLNMGILCVFSLDVFIGWIIAPNRLIHLRKKWYECIVFISLLQFVFFPVSGSLPLLLQQGAIIIILLSRTTRLHAFVSMLSLRPAQLILSSFALVIAFGTILLMLPISSIHSSPASFVDALFTATSATCVTGFQVNDMSTVFSLYGQTVILILVQIGGLGIMTYSVCFALLMHRHLSLRNQSIMQDVLDQDTLSSVRRMVHFIVLMTFLLELLGAIALFAAWYTPEQPILTTLRISVFHSISAFCNSGYSTFTNNLVNNATNLAVNLIIALLVILGGVGFFVMHDLYLGIRQFFRRGSAPHRFRLQSRLVLGWTTALLLLGTGLFYLLERNHLLASATIPDALLMSFFQSAATRSAGFSTCDFGALQSSTLFICIALMFIGASPGGTGGGIKTTTLAVLWAFMRAGFHNRSHVELCRRTIPVDLVQRAVMLLCTALLLVLGGTVLLSVFENKPFMSLFFEVVSAYATVGLSTGITPELSAQGHLVLCLLMFIGRLGPLTIGFALMLRTRPSAHYTYATERVMIG